MKCSTSLYLGSEKCVTGEKSSGNMRPKVPDSAKKKLLSLGINLSYDDWRYGLTPTQALATELVKLKPIVNGYSLIRVGGRSDGSYVVPDDFEGIDGQISPGYGNLSLFEDDLFYRRQIPSYIIDPEIPLSNTKEYLNFTKGRLGLDDDSRNVSLETWISSLNIELEQDKWLLQLDIEGSEWEVLYQFPVDKLDRFRIIVVELHQMELLMNRLMFERFYKPTLTKLLKNFDVVYAHPNNSKEPFSFSNLSFPKIIEITLHNKRRRKINLRNAINQAKIQDFPTRPDLPDFQINWNMFEKYI